MIVMKFGGSSLANAQRLQSIEKIVHSRLDLKPVLVLSAMGDTTDHLLQAAEDALSTGATGGSIEKITETHISALSGLGLAETGMAVLRPLLTELGS
jgi:aspartate kinase